VITVRQIQRLWDDRKYHRLIAELIEARVESSPRLATRLDGSIAAAALGLIRLEELDQAHTPLAATLLRCIIASQGNDGGWNDPLLCALCVRALLTCRGHGVAIDRGMQFLAQLQKSEGIWPNESLRRMPADSYVSAFILLQLGSSAGFRDVVRSDEAWNWFDSHARSLDGETCKLLSHARLRAGVTHAATEVVSWS
jgi:hypothetical protein